MIKQITFSPIGKIMHTMIALAIKKGCAERKQNELFISNTMVAGNPAKFIKNV